MKNPIVKIIAGFLGIGMLIPGLAKFTDKFAIMFRTQISAAEIPFPTLSFYGGRLTEIIVGLVLIYILLYGNKLSSNIRNKLFYISHIIILIMMSVAVYVHLHPDVPAEVLPFETKPPYIPIGYIILVLFNMYLFKKQTSKN